MQSAEARDELQATYLLWRHYRPEAAPYCFAAREGMEAVRWQAATREMLAKAIGFQDLPRRAA